MKRFYLLFTLLGLSLVGHPQTAGAQKNPDPLEAYVRQGLQTNLVLKQRNIELAKAMSVLEESRLLFLPTANLNSGYTSGAGGRYIDLPIGDLLNPVYTTLNQQTGSNDFPQVKNVQTYFFPNNQWDAHVRTSMAVVNPDLWYNRAIQKENVQLKDYEVAIYKRELVKSIKTAYYNVLLAQANLSVQESALALVHKQLETSRKLVAQGSALPATIHRAQAEHGAVESQLAAAKNNSLNASQYFNFLLNQDLATPVATGGYNADAALAEYSAMPTQGDEREELKALGKGVAITNLQQSMRQAFWYPRVNTFLDLGNQSAGGLKYNNKSRYFLFGVTLDVPLFSWGTNNLKTRRAGLDIEAIKLNKQNTEQALTLANQNAKNNIEAAKAQLTSANSQIAAARSYYQLAEKAFAAGAMPFIEYLDARTQITQAELGLNVAKYRLLQAYAAQEREAATYSLN